MCKSDAVVAVVVLCFVVDNLGFEFGTGAVVVVDKSAALLLEQGCKLEGRLEPELSELQQPPLVLQAEVMICVCLLRRPKRL